MEERNNDQEMTNAKVLHKKLEAIGWGLFFVWVGIAFAAHVGWGAGLLGVGIITLGGQVMRKYFALRVEVFWVMVGFFFLLGGVGNYLMFALSSAQFCALLQALFSLSLC